MAAITSILTAAAIGVSVAGVGVQLAGADAAAGAAAQNAAAQKLQQQAQIAQIHIQQKGQADLAAVQKDYQALQTQQALNVNLTNQAMFAIQGQQQQLAQQGNLLQQGLNTVKADANAQLQALNNQNATLNNQAFQLGQQNFGLQQQQLGNQIDQLGIQQQQVGLQQQGLGIQGQRLGVQSQQVGLNDRLARLANMQNQRQAIRQGLALQASGLQNSVNQGAQTSSRTSQVRGNAINQAYGALQQSNQKYGGQQAGFALQQQDISLQQQALGLQSQGLDLQSQYYGIGQQNLGLQQQQIGNQAGIAALGNQSYNLGVDAQNIQYGVNQAQFAVADQMYGIQGQQYALAKQGYDIQGISNAANNQYIKQAYTLNEQLLNTNTANSAAVAAAQEQVIAAGGAISDANYAAAQAGTLSSIGQGISSFGNIASSSTFQSAATNLFNNFGGTTTGGASVGQPMNILPSANFTPLYDSNAMIG